jgi:hypothetical protein
MRCSAWIAGTAGALAAFDQPPPLSPGLWEVTLRTDGATLRSGSPEALAAIRRELAKPLVTRICLTLKQIKQGPSAMFGQSGCKVEQVSAENGELSAHTTCKTPRGSTMWSGVIMPTRYHLTGINFRRAGAAMIVNQFVVGRRLSTSCRIQKS